MITDTHYEDLDKLLKTAVDADNLLSEWEQGFVSEWCDKLDAYGTGVRISDKQQAIFDRIEDKLKKEGLL